MIAGGVQAPERALDPECRVSEREILRRRLERKPNPAQTVRLRQQTVFRHVEIVIPNETPVPRGLVSKNCCEYKNDRKQPDTLTRQGEVFSFIHQDSNYRQIIPRARAWREERYSMMPVPIESDGGVHFNQQADENRNRSPIFSIANRLTNLC